MTLNELKNWINSLPNEFLEYSVVACERGNLDEDYTYRLDMPFVKLDVDENTKEVLMEVVKQIDDSEISKNRIKRFGEYN